MSINPDVVGYTAAFLTSMSFLPQVVKTIKSRDTKSLSGRAYGALSLGILLWCVYGILKQDLVIILANCVSLALVLIIFGVKIQNLIKSK